MNFNLLYIAFLSQIILLSVVLPKRQVAQMEKMMSDYPPSEYPRLYPQEESHYKASRRNFFRLCLVIGAIGLAVLAWLMTRSVDEGMIQPLITGFFLLQSVPWMGLDYSALREYRLMRLLNKQTSRSADLRPRRLSDAVPISLVFLAGAVYFIFCSFIVWMTQFDYSWFGGYLNIVILTAANLVGVIVAWRLLRGKRHDPHESEADRVLRAGATIRVLLLISIALSLYAMLTISLKALGLEAWQAITLCIYYQVIALLTLKSYRFKRNDYEVYRESVVE